MTVEDVAPRIDPGPLLPGAQFMDAYRLEVDGENLDARKAAERMMARAPRWVDMLLALRNIIVAPFGLKTSGEDRRAPRDINRDFPRRQRDTGTAGRGLQRQASRFPRRRRCRYHWPTTEHHRNHAGADAQLAGANVPDRHHAVSPAGGPRYAEAGDAALGMDVRVLIRAASSGG
jgi:hypothetical protein